MLTPDGKARKAQWGYLGNEAQLTAPWRSLYVTDSDGEVLSPTVNFAGEGVLERYAERLSPELLTRINDHLKAWHVVVTDPDFPKKLEALIRIWDAPLKLEGRHADRPENLGMGMDLETYFALMNEFFVANDTTPGDNKNTELSPDRVFPKVVFVENKDDKTGNTLLHTYRDSKDGARIGGLHENLKGIFGQVRDNSMFNGVLSDERVDDLATRALHSLADRITTSVVGNDGKERAGWKLENPSDKKSVLLLQTCRIIRRPDDQLSEENPCALTTELVPILTEKDALSLTARGIDPKNFSHLTELNTAVNGLGFGETILSTDKTAMLEDVTFIGERISVGEITTEEEIESAILQAVLQNTAIFHNIDTRRGVVYGQASKQVIEELGFIRRGPAAEGLISCSPGEMVVVQTPTGPVMGTVTKTPEGRITVTVPGMTETPATQITPTETRPAQTQTGTPTQGPTNIPEATATKGGENTNQTAVPGPSATSAPAETATQAGQVVNTASPQPGETGPQSTPTPFGQ
jgi:hypothetical protein